jgi:3-oxoacyl-[acyl-carrier-protein] synthase III
MSFISVNNISIRGLSACVPANEEQNRTLELFSNSEEAEKFINTTGVESRHIVGSSGICTSDLCYEAAVRLLKDLNWNPEDIGCLIFVSQTPDYILPATSCILQSRLGLPNDVFALDISLGCSGWVYGLSVISKLMAGGEIKRGLLLAGDTTSVTKSRKDKSTYPLFGDAGTATAIEFIEGATPVFCQTGTDGRGYEAIMIPDGGFRNFTKPSSFIESEVEPGIIRNRLQSVLNGPAVFTFGLSRAPQSINALAGHFNLDLNKVDYFIFHQANMFMNEKIRAKLKIPPEKAPYSLKRFGNTSSASIPLTIVTEIGDKVRTGKKQLIVCAFGVGLSWATAHLEISEVVCPELIKI